MFVKPEAKTQYLIRYPADEIQKINSLSILQLRLCCTPIWYPSARFSTLLKFCQGWNWKCPGFSSEIYNFCVAVQIYLQSLTSTRYKHTDKPRHTNFIMVWNSRCALGLASSLLTVNLWIVGVLRYNFVWTADVMSQSMSCLVYTLYEEGIVVWFSTGAVYFLLYQASRLALRPNKSPIQWVTVSISRETKRSWCETDHSSTLNAKVKNVSSYNFTLASYFTAWLSIW